MNPKYNGLKLIGKISKFLGVVGIILGFISLIVAPLALSQSDSLFTQMGFQKVAPGTGLLVGLLTGVILFFLGSALGMLLFAAGECFNVLINIEANTRKTVDLLEKE
jgi:hypothetical protein